MRALLVAAVVLTAAPATACGGRQVEVQTGSAPAASATLHVVNNMSQPVRVYVVSGGSDIFLREVPSRGTEGLSVTGVAAGSVVTLKAVTADGTRTITKDGVQLTSSYHWEIP